MAGTLPAQVRQHGAGDFEQAKYIRFVIAFYFFVGRLFNGAEQARARVATSGSSRAKSRMKLSSPGWRTNNCVIS